MARLTLYGWLNYNPDLFKDIVVPEVIDKDTLINEIIKSCGDLYTYHQSPIPFKQNIDYWFSRKAYDFERIYLALRTEYNPLENYDRREEIDRSYENGGADSTSSSSSANSIGNSSSSDTLGGTTTDKVSAYNTSDFQNQSQSVNSSNSSSNATNSANSHANATSETRYGSTYSDKENNRIHGNIGVTMAQAMAMEEIKLRSTMDLYKIIAKAFEREFLVQIY